ncbi:cytochrome c oxidase assembly protein [Methylopila musalis]|uniref:Cytochrome c oxidase assembly protein n=1 Tax=Methylopila musalis TaxID=1134781 RepID=A0ABW3Z758_9HYPH
MTPAAAMRLGFGLAVLAAAWAPGTEAALGGGFAAHMTRHMALLAVASALIALGLAGSRFDPTARAPLLFAAVPASLFELLAVWGWHAPGAHDLARASGLAFAAEQATFLLAGLWLWLACFGRAGAVDLARAGQGVLAMLLTSIHMTLFGVLLATTTRPLYDPALCGGASLLTGQHLGGVIMLLVGGGVYFAAGLTLAARLLKDDVLVSGDDAR